MNDDLRVAAVSGSLTQRMRWVEDLAAHGIPAVGLAPRELVALPAELSLVILDAEHDGVEAFLARDDRLQRAVAMVRDDETARIAALRAGADEVLVKGVQDELLPDVVAQLLAAPRPPGGSATVLVVEDSATARAQLCDELRRAGYRVVTAVDGETGLRLAAEVPHHAIISDAHLPGIGGLELIRRVKADQALRGTPCLLLTGSDQAEVEQVALDAGADAYISKAAGPGVVQARLRALLRDVGTASRPGQLIGCKRLLAVDDSLTYLETLREHLESEGYEVLTASGGKEALGLLARERVDAILLDLVMPEIDGEAVCRRVKADASWSDIPLLLLTAKDDPETLVRGIDAGADDYVVKSATFSVLTSRLRAQLRRRHFEDESRRINEELMRMQLEAAEAENARDLAERENRIKTQFLANMSHELRTPLNAIIGFSEMMESGRAGELESRQERYVNHILTSARHLLSLINDILDLSKICADGVELELEEVALAGLIDESLAVVAEAARAKRIELASSIDDDLPVIRADRKRVHQILLNLLSNAVKYTPDGGRVTVTCGVSGANLMIRVADTGAGIGAADLPRLFREFTQLDESYSRKQEGTGLGLAITKRLVEMHGGRVTATSEGLGAGSTFTVALPLAGG